MKRAFVPAALHAELTEYTNLVRVLRTTRTLDLTAHLLHHAAQHSHTDTWTPWPLIDCPVPEWPLHDEIQHLAEQAREDADEDSLSPAAMRHLVLHTGAMLVHILNLLADQRPSAPGSMQNRLWAMNWEDVLSLLAVSGVVDPAYVLVRYRSRPFSSMPSILARAEKRLERIYGPSTTRGKPSLRLLGPSHLSRQPWRGANQPRQPRRDSRFRRITYSHPLYSERIGTTPKVMIVCTFPKRHPDDPCRSPIPQKRRQIVRRR
jgi:hypothetical protein